MGHHDPGVGYVQHVLQHLALVGGIERDKHGAEVVDGEKSQDGLFAVEHPYRHVVALGDTLAGKTACQASHFLQQRCVGPAVAVLEHGELFVGHLDSPALQQVAGNTTIR